MRLFDKIFGKPGPVEVDVISTSWRAYQSNVSRSLRYTGLTSDGLDTVVQILLICEFLNNEPIILLSLSFEPKLHAAAGYLTARCVSPAGDTPFFPVQLKHEDDETVIQLIDGDSGKLMLRRLMDGESLLFSLGGPAGDLLKMPIPHVPDLEANLEQAWAWSKQFGQDLSLSS